MIDFENSLTFVLTQLAIAARTNLEKALSGLDLHSGQIFLLISLWKSDGQSQIELVRNVGIAAPTVNKMIKSLARRDFVVCRKCPSDGRLLRVFLTKKGSECQAAVAAQWEKVETGSYSNLTETEKLVLGQLFGKMKENLSRNNVFD